MSAAPNLEGGAMVVALSGWMDGGSVSTGAVEWLARQLDARTAGEIDPSDFYLFNFPGTMEFAALFRPSTRIENGRVVAYQPPENVFACAAEQRLALFHGKEPHLLWDRFADCVFEGARRCRIKRLYFIGSVGGAVPHTREPRIFCTISDEALRPELARVGVRFSNYEGPASFSTLLFNRAPAAGLELASLVAEIPAYVQGVDPHGVEAVLRKLLALLGLQLDLSEVRTMATHWESRINEALADKEELSGHIRKLEEDYDNDVFDTQMGDLKIWLEQQGIRVD
jgi:predicted ATP-grasp superfamily ATP-dependent carboligase